MDDLIRRIVAETGLDAARAGKAAGILFALIATQGDKAGAARLFDALPGAAELARQHGGDGAAGSGLLGMLAGGMMGGPLAMITKLQAAGLSTDQIKAVTALTIDHAKSVAGADVLRKAAANIPGLSGYL